MTGPNMRLSLVVMAYRQEATIADTITAAFAQDHHDLEIVLTDDASPDGTFAVMEKMAAVYRGPHHVVLNRNPQNLGLIGHVNHLFNLVTSDWLIYNAGDDMSEPHRARAIAEVIARDNPRYIHSDVTDLHADGQAFGRQRDRTRHAELEAMSLPQLARAMSHGIGATAVWHRDLFRIFGPITETGLYEDRVLLFRARLIGTVGYVPDRLVRYRRGMGLSSRKDMDPAKLLQVDLATLRQRRADVLKVAPDRRDILKALDKKQARRERELAEVLAGGTPTPDGSDDD
jgi:glycosyltransferase involved in cell wall biosynthesis